MIALHSNAKVGKAQKRTSGGREYYVLPTVAIVEGVLNEVLVPAKTIEKFYESWNGRPVPIGHPKLNGEFVTANRHDIADLVVAGAFWNVNYKAGKLSGEIWVDIERAKGLKDGPRLLERIESDKPIEVSTAYWMEAFEEAGDWNGKPYQMVAESLGADHLALLLDETGACSLDDGCGALRTNQIYGESDVLLAFQVYEGQVDLDYELPTDAELTPPGDHHITLAYLGPLENLGISEQDLAKLVGDFARYNVGVVARTNGIGRFYGEEQDAVWVGVSSPPLMDFRANLCNFIRSIIPYSDSYGFTPHITLAYVDRDAEVSITPKEPVDLAFNLLTLKVGNTVYSFSLQGYVEEVKVEMAMSANCNCKEQKMTESTKDPVVNEETIEVPQPQAIEVEGLAEAQAFIAELKTLGDPQEFLSAIRSLKTNADEQRGEVIAEIVANKASAFGETDLQEMTTDQLVKLAQSLRTPNYAGRGAFRSNGDESEWEVYEPKKEAK